MNMNITESGNYQKIRKAAGKALFIGIFGKVYFKFCIIIKAEIFHTYKPRNLSGLAYRFKNHYRYYNKTPTYCQRLCINIILPGRTGFQPFLVCLFVEKLL